MARPYFNFFPQIQYDIDKDNTPILATSIMHRFKFLDKIINKLVLFQAYIIPEGERPDQVADRFYNDPSLDWLIILINQIIDPQFEWPLYYLQFIEFLKKKYGSVRNAHQTNHHYLLIIQAETQREDGTTQPTRTVVIDETTYLATPEESRLAVSCYQYEKDLNEARKAIKILDQSYLGQVITEADRIFANAH